MERYWGMLRLRREAGGGRPGLGWECVSFRFGTEINTVFHLNGPGEPVQNLTKIWRFWGRRVGLVLRLRGWVGGACTGLGWEFGRFRFGTQINNTGFSFVKLHYPG